MEAELRSFQSTPTRPDLPGGKTLRISGKGNHRQLLAEPVGNPQADPGESGDTQSESYNVYARVMRTNIDIDDELLAQAAEVAGTTTKRATVEYALAELVRRKDRRAILRLKGEIAWEGDLDRSRLGRSTR
jgi:Arc/MetJ family transcription regulator